MRRCWGGGRGRRYVGSRLPGLPDQAADPHSAESGGNLSASYLSVGFLLSDSSYRYFYVVQHLLGWFCHSHGDTTVSPKRRILVITLPSSS